MGMYKHNKKQERYIVFYQWWHDLGDTWHQIGMIKCQGSYKSLFFEIKDFWEKKITLHISLQEEI